MIVKEELKKMMIPYIKVELGEVELKNTISLEQREELARLLLKFGLELMEDKKAMLIEKIKIGKERFFNNETVDQFSERKQRN